MRRSRPYARTSSTTVRTVLVAAALGAALGAAALTAAAAVEIQAGQIYTGGTRLEVSEYGVAFTLPTGWRGAALVLEDGTEAFQMQPETDPNVLLLAVGDEGSRTELVQRMAGPIPLGGGLALSPSGAISERGSAIAQSYQVVGSPTPLAAYGEGLAGSHGIAVAYLLIASPESISAWKGALQSVTDSTRLGAPAGAGGGAPGAGAGSTAGGAAAGSQQTWEDYLKGKYIVRYFTRTGYTDEEHIWLCSNGSFQRRGAAGGFGGGASGAFQSDSTGRWTATGAGEHGTLTLRYGNGQVGEYQLRWDFQNSHLYVDGKRWYHDKNEVCD